MLVDILSAKAARQITMNSDSKINDVLKRIEETIKKVAGHGFFAVRIYWSDYGICSCDGAIKERVKDVLESSGYTVDSGNKTCDSSVISWRN